METRKTYRELLTKPLLSQEEEKKVLIFENFLRKSKEYEEYLNEENHQIVKNYEHEIFFLNSLKEEEKNQNINRSIQVGLEICQITSLEERKRHARDTQEQKEQNMELKLQKRAGYTNASILIFVICNLGFFLAAILLILQ